MTEGDSICYMFMWWVCSRDGKRIPMAYTDAKKAVQKDQSKWLEIIAA